MSILITTPIYYVNAEPHLGHAYSTVIADILARAHRQAGGHAVLQSGTDEHGEPIARAAAAAGVSPAQLVERNARHFSLLAESLHAEVGINVRTTQPDHQARVQRALTRLRESGLLYQGRHRRFFCPACADFLTPDKGDDAPCCPEHGLALEVEEEENWFFRWSSYQTRLEGLLESRPDWIWPLQHRGQAQALLAQGLPDISFSRPNTSWGVPLPWDEEQTVYVWADALLNYLTGPARLGLDSGSEPLTVWHVLGKDIIKFHALLLPALWWALDQPLPDRLLVGGHLLVEGRKASKSRGNTLSPTQALELLGADALRFALCWRVPYGQDGSLGFPQLRQAYRELGNGLGNLLRRTGALAQPYPELPQLESEWLAETFSRAARERAGRLSQGDAPGALQAGWRALQESQRWLERAAPWQLEGEARARAIALAVEAAARCLLLLAPWLPQATERLSPALRLDQTLEGLESARALSRSLPEGLPILWPRLPC